MRVVVVVVVVVVVSKLWLLAEKGPLSRRGPCHDDDIAKEWPAMASQSCALETSTLMLHVSSGWKSGCHMLPTVQTWLVVVLACASLSEHWIRRRGSAARWMQVPTCLLHVAL